jgi:arylsulfatase A-like enzyme
MIATWSGKIKPGTETDLISVFYDVMPTFCEIAGIEHPEDIDGISFLPTLLGSGNQKSHEFLYWEFPEYGGQQAVRMGKWKGIRKDIFKNNLKTELYNLEEDIREQNDVAAQHPEIVKKIEEILIREHTPSENDRFKFTQLGD